MNRRNRIGIIIDILNVALEGSSRTGIMYRANLNFGRFEKYFEELLEKGLIENVTSNNLSKCPVYKTTEKAKMLLKELNRAEQYIKLSA